MTSSEPEQRERHSTGLPGLDTIIHGGFLTGSVYIVRGTPGAGKTILASQMCFHWARHDEHCLYMTLLSESHDRLIDNLKRLDFYSDEFADHIQYQSGFKTLEEDGLSGVLRLLISESKRYDSSLIVLDGLFALKERVDSEREFRLFMNQLQNLAHLTGATMLLLTNSERGESSPEFTMVDGWMELAVQRHDYRVSRYLQVHKLRGSGFASGQHTLKISDTGIEILPRLESVQTQKPTTVREVYRLSTGIPDLDQMMGGGLRNGSNTLVAGATGTGKTAIGLQFIAEASAVEPGLIFGFYESEGDLVEKAQALGIRGLPRGLGDGSIQVLWHHAGEHLLDEMAYDLIRAVRERGVKRLLVDGINAMKQSAVHPERFSRFLSTLTNLLRHEDVTAVFTMETPELVGGNPYMNLSAVSAVAQNIVLLRYVELFSEMRRNISIIKSRTSRYDPSIREFRITNQGIKIDGTFEQVEGVMTGYAHPRNPEASDTDE